MSQPRSLPLSSRWALAAILASVSLLSACVMVPARPYYAGGYSAGGEVIPEAPPPQYEVVGVAPGPGYVWIGGYWNWVGRRHVWIGGHWRAPGPVYRRPHM